MLTQRILPTLLATALFSVFASTAFADKIIIDGHTNYRDGVGGEFNVRPIDADGVAFLNLSSGYFMSGGSVAGGADGTLMKANNALTTLVGFQTFCIEYNEYITLPGTYEAAIGTAAVKGGLGGQTSPNSDPVSVGTGYLYTLFATGSLTGYTYLDGSGAEVDGLRAQAAEKLQKAFWYLEDEMAFDTAGGLANPFLLTALTKFGNPDLAATRTAAKADNNGAYSVKVLNIWTESSPGVVKQYNQSQLIMVPDGGATLMLLSFGLSGLALLRRKAD